MEIWSQEPHNNHRIIEIRDGEIFEGDESIGVHFQVSDSNFDEIKVKKIRKIGNLSMKN